MNRSCPGRIGGNSSIPRKWSSTIGLDHEKETNLAMKAAPYSLINEFLYKMGLDGILKRCVLEHEIDNIMYEAHYGPTRGHFYVDTTAKKIQ